MTATPASLLTERAAHVAAIAAIDRQLAAAGYRPRVPRSKFRGGTAHMLRRYATEAWDGRSPITAASAEPWMTAHGWHTDTPDRRQAVAVALSYATRGRARWMRRDRPGGYWPTWATRTPARL